MMASSIGLVVTAGITNTFVQMSQRIRQIEAKQQKELFYNYIRRHFKDSANCVETLNAKGGTGSTKIYYSNGDADNNGELDPPPAGTTHPPGFVDLTPTDGKDDHQWTVPKLLRPDGSDADTDPEVHLDFYPSTPADKEKLKRKFWEKWGIEKFNALVYTHDTINGPYLSVHTWNIAPGGMPYPAGPYKIPLTVTASAPGGSDKGEKITSCSTKLEHVTEAPRTHAMREDRFFQKCKIDKNLHPHSYKIAKGGGLIHNNVIIGNNVTVDLNAIICKGTVSPAGQMILTGKAVWLKGNVYTSTLGRIGVHDEAEVDVGAVYVSSAGGSLTVSGEAKLHVPSISTSGRVIVDNAKVKLSAHGIASSVNISGNTKILGKETIVKGKVELSHGPKISDGATIDGTNGQIQITGTAEISGVNTIITGTTISTSSFPLIIGGNAKVTGGIISEKTTISGSAQVSGGTIKGVTSIFGNAEIHGGNISGNSNSFYGNAVIRGGTIFKGVAYGHVEIKEGTTSQVSHATINGNRGAANPIIIKDGAEIKGKAGARITISGGGTIASSARIYQDTTVSGTVSDTRGTPPP